MAHPVSQHATFVYNIEVYDRRKNIHTQQFLIKIDI